MDLDNNQSLKEARRYWDSEAAAFDKEPDHGLRDPFVRDAWKNLLLNWLPKPPAKVLDIGCGTGSLSVLMAELDFSVTGIDLSPEMITRAEAKVLATDQTITFHVMDASQPKFVSRQFDVIVCRHLLWALPEPAQVLLNWSTLLVPKGRLSLIEGYWHNGGGLHAQQIVDALPPSFSNIIVQDLSENPDYWGGTVNDERYLIKADKK
jgi:2-polyprenyl-3-methyl-5-hydroxy-6-metoxy-1,4-benzoquinol methylase